MSFNSLVALTAESGVSHEGGGVSPWVVGPGIFVLLLVVLLVLVSFGGGRDHS